MSFSRLSLAAAVVLAAAAGTAWWWAARPAVEYRTQPVARADVEATVTAIGTLQPRRYVDVGAQVSGLIQRLAVAPGSVVAKGDLLVEIDPSVQQATVDAGRAGLAALRAQLADQQAQQRLAVQQLKRQQRLAADEATRDEDLQTAEAMLASTTARVAQLAAQVQQTQATQRADEARLGYTRIYAPMAGTVVSVEAREGQTLNATYQTPNILRIADLSSMTVWTEVSEADVRRVKSGMPVSFATLGGVEDSRARRWSGSVRQVLPAPPVADNKNAATAGATGPVGKAVVYTVLFDVDNRDGELMPQMTAQVAFVAARAQAVLAVPLAALAADERQPGGYVARVLDADGRPQSRQVAVGVRSRHQAEVREGLVEGDRLVVGEAARSGPRWVQW